MKKADLINEVASGADITKKAAGKAVDSFIDTVSSALARKQTVTLVGFGTFYVARRAARKGRNPRTGATLNIPSKSVPRFRAGAALKQRVR